MEAPIKEIKEVTLCVDGESVKIGEIVTRFFIEPECDSEYLDNLAKSRGLERPRGMSDELFALYMMEFIEWSNHRSGPDLLQEEFGIHPDATRYDNEKKILYISKKKVELFVPQYIKIVWEEELKKEDD